ncbi:MAG: integrase core domain-containing protein [bacterium]|nr:integrase core domain-containing protein [bacterium]
MRLNLRRTRSGEGFHSDQGGQYNEKEFKKLLKNYGMRSSMGTSGDCYDNAPMESFWATMKTELMHHMPFRDVQHAREVIERWLHLFYNPRRRHTSIKGMSPMKYEEQCLKHLPTVP